MKRIARHLFTVCTALSLLLCVLVGVLWVRSHYVWDMWIHVARLADGADGTRMYALGTSRGRAMVGQALIPVGPDGRDAIPRWPIYRRVGPDEVARGSRAGFWGRLGFVVDSDPRFVSARVTFPMWAVAALGALLPAVAVRRLSGSRAARRRAARALCRRLGATADRGRHQGRLAVHHCRRPGEAQAALPTSGEVNH